MRSADTQPVHAAVVRFVPFELDLRTGQLCRDGKLINLQPQPTRILVLLAGRPGEVITRQELAQHVWGADTFVDFEQGLNFAIRQIRAALEDDADHPQYVETVHKRGYRFIGPIEQPPSVTSRKLALVPPTENVSNETRTERRVRQEIRKWLAIVLVTVLLIAAIAFTLSIPFQGNKPVLAGAVQSIAVLPLANLSADPAQDYFTEGLTDELITELAKLRSVRVISRTSTMTYKGRQVALPLIGRELGADAIVEGSVERVGERVRIRAQLIHAASDRHLWAESYDRDGKDILSLEKEVATDIARQIGQLGPEFQAPSTQQTVSAVAHDDYLRGRYYWNKRTEPGLRRAIEYFRKAIHQEPGYASAYAGLADSYIMLANWGFAPSLEVYPEAKKAALKAVELDPTLAEAQTSLAYVMLLYDWDWKGAEKKFRQAIALNPNYASAHHFYSILLVSAGRQEEAIAEIERAQALDPMSLIVNDVVGWIYYEGRQYDRAVAQFNRTLELDPNYSPALMDLGTAYLRTGRREKALKAFEKARSVAGDNGVVMSDLAQAYAVSGNRSAAQEILRKVQASNPKLFVSEWDLSLVHLALGDKEKTIELLDKAADKRVGWIIRLRVDPAFDSIRDDPRFQQLLRRVGVLHLTNSKN